jgi:hypothetical protein
VYQHGIKLAARKKNKSDLLFDGIVESLVAAVENSYAVEVASIFTDFDFCSEATQHKKNS